MKKTFLLILTLALTAATVYAQDKLFKDALSQTRPTGCWYKWENTKDKQIKMEKVQAYALKNNLELGKITTKEVGRFGEVAISVHTVEFIPPEEIPAYMIENLFDNTISSAYLTGKGSVLVVDNPYQKNHFKWVNDALWSGNVIDGKIDGKGKGAKQIDATNYIAFEGTFKKGIPQGTVKFYTYQAAKKYEYYSSKKRSTLTSETGTMKEGMAWFKAQEKGYYNYYYGFIDENGRVVVDPVYNSVTDYSNGTATVVIYNQVQFDVDKQGTITGLHSGQTVSLQQLVDIKKYKPKLLSATQAAAKKMIPQSNVDDLNKIATEFTDLRDDVEAKLKRDIPSYTLADLAKVDNAFSNLKDLTLKRRTAIYNADCAKLATAYSNAVASSKQHQENMNDRGFVNQFVSNYENYYTFDPDHKVAVAKQIQEYYQMCDARLFEPSSSYTCLSCDPPQYYGATSSDFSSLVTAWNKTSNPPADFKEYADYARPIIERKGNSLYNIVCTEYEAYKRALFAAWDAAYKKVEAVNSYSDIKPYINEESDFESTSKSSFTRYRFEGFDIFEHWDGIYKNYSYSYTVRSKEGFWPSQEGHWHSQNKTPRGRDFVKVYKDAATIYLDKKYNKSSFGGLQRPWNH